VELSVSSSHQRVEVAAQLGLRRESLDLREIRGCSLVEVVCALRVLKRHLGRRGFFELSEAVFELLPERPLLLGELSDVDDHRSCLSRTST
jgi:hypothetical protein